MSKRKHLTAEQKVAVIRRHLIENVPVSDLCEELGVHPNQYYNWQKTFFENGAILFERKSNAANESRQKDANERKIEMLEKKLQDRNEVVAELMQEHVNLKKANGEL
jgi:transposase-like protein